MYFFTLISTLIVLRYAQFSVNEKIAARFFIYGMNYVDDARSSITFHSAPANIRTSTADVTREPGSTPLIRALSGHATRGIAIRN